VFDPGAPAVGYIIGSFYCDKRIPPYKDEHKTYINFEDSTLIEYDKKLHTLSIKISESGDMSINIETSSDINVLCKKNVNLSAKGEMYIHSDGEMLIDSSTHITLKAPRIDENPD
jgi:phage baseplate assembly protein gpV